MSDYHRRFKSCGQNVTIAADVFIEHPEVMEVGDNARFMRGVHIEAAPEVCRLGADVTFYPYSYITGSPRRFIVGDTVAFHPHTYISLGHGPEAFLDIGHRSHFAAQCALYGGGGLTVGPFCNVAAHTVLSTVEHDPDTAGRPMCLGVNRKAPITLVEDVWLGANVTVTPGVTIAEGCVVGANAVVTRDTEPRGVYMGVPARRVRDR